MAIKKAVLDTLGVSGAAGEGDRASLDKDSRAFLATTPIHNEVLFWTVPQRDAAFRMMDRLPLLAKSHVVPASGTPSTLPAGAPLKLTTDVDAYMAGQRNAAMLIVQDGRLRMERYGLGFGPEGRWTSFSVAKSFTSTLVGAAVKDGFIKNLDDKVSVYIPDLKGSAYDDVSVRQLLTMTSGVKWAEDYNDPNSDVAQFTKQDPEDGMEALVSYMRKLPRAAPAGTRWLYSTGETNLVGTLVQQATKKHLATYLAEKVWGPAGMEQQATWLLSKTGQEIGGCCVQAASRDYARMGVFILNGAMVNGASIVPDGWWLDATTKRADIGEPGRGYGYQWWTYDDGSFTARGIFGQGIFIDPKRKLVIVSNANWAGGASDPVAMAARDAFYLEVQKAIDLEGVALSQ